MRKLFLDIETVPAEEEQHEVLRQIHKKRLADGKKVGSFAEYLEATTFDGSFGTIGVFYGPDNQFYITTPNKILQFTPAD